MSVRGRPLIALCSVVLLGACGTAKDEPAATGAPTTRELPSTVDTTGTTDDVPADVPADVEEVYRRAEASLREMGIALVTVEAQAEGLADYTATTELWLDAAGDRFR
jgi:hypothetical protein